MDYYWGDSNGDTRIAIIFGFICGILKLLDIHLLVDSYIIVCVKVLFTGIVGGIGGVIGKHIITYTMKKWKNRFTKNKQP